jgi:hypothetical protein
MQSTSSTPVQWTVAVVASELPNRTRALAIDQFGSKTRTVLFVQSCECSSFRATGELDGK